MDTYNDRIPQSTKAATIFSSYKIGPLQTVWTPICDPVVDGKTTVRNKNKIIKDDAEWLIDGEETN